MIGARQFVQADLGRLGRFQRPLPFGDDAGGDGIADDVGGRAPHVEEMVDGEDQQQAGLGDVNTGKVAAITTRLARGTPAIPLEVISKVSSIVTCAPIDRWMS